MNQLIAPESLHSPADYDIADRLTRIEQRDLRWNALHQHEQVVLRRDELGNRVIDLTPERAAVPSDGIHPSSARPQIRQWRKQYVGPDTTEHHSMTMLDGGGDEIDAWFSSLTTDESRVETTPSTPYNWNILIEPDESPVPDIIDLRSRTEAIEHLFEGTEADEPESTPASTLAELHGALLLEAEMITAGAAAQDEAVTPKRVQLVTAEPASEKRRRFKRFGTAITAGVLAVGALVGGMLSAGSQDKALEVAPIDTPAQMTTETPFAPPAQAVEAVPVTIETIDEANLRLVLNGLSECTQLYGSNGCLQAMEYAAFVSQ